MSVWVLASMPFWVSGALFSWLMITAAAKIVLHPDRREDMLGEFIGATIFSVAFLAFAGWMCS